MTISNEDKKCSDALVAALDNLCRERKYDMESTSYKENRVYIKGRCVRIKKKAQEFLIGE